MTDEKKQEVTKREEAKKEVPVQDPAKEECTIEKTEKKEFDITEHFLVPKHEVMATKEKEKLLKDFNITEKQLPHILRSDPAAKEIGAKLGDVVKITRKSQVAGKCYYYRIVVK